MKDSPKKGTNSLTNSKSPYLLLHAENPVNWYPWGEEAFALARKRNQPIIISIGYSSCHWCHVMNRETFSDEEAAELMNKYFVCIKVDREERPDVDRIYMDALNFMQVQGGWPLNCFLLPDGKPFWGGTYFSLNDWKEILISINELFHNQKARVEHHAQSITQSLKTPQQEYNLRQDAIFNIALLDKIFINIRRNLDFKDGGFAFAPKFPMPLNILFQIRYAFSGGTQESLGQALLTLEKIAMGGIYDHIGGGFARYATDTKWKIPHFEKMLYDNALLVMVYVEAYLITNNDLFFNVINDTLSFVTRELSGNKGQFFSAVDADSEGIEGKYYVWTRDEINEVLGRDAGIFCRLFGVNTSGYWENNNNILLLSETVKSFAIKHFLDYDDFESLIKRCRENLFTAREKRIKPFIDTKTLTSWNALMIKAFAEAFLTTGNNEYKTRAFKSEEFVNENLKMTDGGLYHIYNDGPSDIKGFLDDYAFMIEAYTALYKISFQEKYLFRAKKLIEYTLKQFGEQSTGLYYYSTGDDPLLIALKAETHDNVTPSANSSLARSLLLYSRIFDNNHWRAKAIKMINYMLPEVINNGYAYSNWALMITELYGKFYTISVTGKGALDVGGKLAKYYFPLKFVAACEDNSEISILKEQNFGEGLKIVICTDKQCIATSNDAEEAIKILNNL